MTLRLFGAALGLLPALALPVPPALAAGFPDGLFETYGDWQLTCDPSLACQAVGFPDDDDFGGWGALIVKREAGPDGAVTAFVTSPMENPQTGLRFDVEGFEAALADPGAVDETGMFRHVFSAKRLPDLLKALNKANVLYIDDPDDDSQSSWVSLTGAMAALRRMDAVQGRAGLPEALVAKGEGTAKMPLAPALPRIAAPALTVSALDGDERPPALVKAWKAACEDWDLLNEEAAQFEAYDMGNGQQMWFTPCATGAYNFQYYAFLRAGKTFAKVDFPSVTGSEIADGGVWNFWVSSALDTPAPFAVTDFSKGRGIGDCGSSTGYVWTGTGWAVTYAARMDTCSGIAPDDWPVQFRAEVVAQ